LYSALGAGDAGDAAASSGKFVWAIWETLGKIRENLENLGKIRENLENLGKS